MDIITGLILAVLCLIVGFLVANLAQGLRHSQRDNPAQDENENRAENLVEEARLYRDQSDGKLVIEADGKVYRTTTDMEPARQQGIERLADELLTWLGRSAEVSHDQAIPDQPDQRLDLAQPVAVQAGSVRVSPPIEMQPNPEIMRPSLNPVKLFTRAITADIPKVNVGFKSITQQIDEILQNLVKDSTFATRGIHLVEEVDGSVRVEIGLDSYAGVEAVPDEAARQMIRQAVAEWEHQNSRGTSPNKNR